MEFFRIEKGADMLIVTPANYSVLNIAGDRELVLSAHHSIESLFPEMSEAARIPGSGIDFMFGRRNFRLCMHLLCF